MSDRDQAPGIGATVFAAIVVIGGAALLLSLCTGGSDVGASGSEEDARSACHNRIRDQVRNSHGTGPDGFSALDETEIEADEWEREFVVRGWVDYTTRRGVETSRRYTCHARHMGSREYQIEIEYRG